jgi:hypothetical protein
VKEAALSVCDRVNERYNTGIPILEAVKVEHMRQECGAGAEHYGGILEDPIRIISNCTK